MVDPGSESVAAGLGEYPRPVVGKVGYKMKYVFGIYAINRAEHDSDNYLAQTMESLKKSGFWEQAHDTRFILSDGGSKDLSYLDVLKGSPIEISTTGEKVHHGVNFRHLLEHALQYEPEYFVLLEDDVIFCKNFFQNLDAFLQEHGTPETWAYDFFSVQKGPKNRSTLAAMNYPAATFWGTQCVALRHIDSLVKFLHSTNRVLVTDHIIKHWLLNNRQKHILTAFPSLVQHVGKASTLWKKSPSPISPTFLGEDVDPSLVAETESSSG